MRILNKILESIGLQLRSLGLLLRSMGLAIREIGLVDRKGNTKLQDFQIFPTKVPDNDAGLHYGIRFNMFELRYIENGSMTLDDLLKIKFCNAKRAIKHQLTEKGILPDYDKIGRDEEFDPVKQDKIMKKLMADMRNGV